MDCSASRPLKRAQYQSVEEYAPATQLCCLSLTEVQAHDLHTTKDLSFLLEVLANGDTERALTAVSGISALLDDDDRGYGPNQVIMRARGMDVLCRAMKHECAQIREKSIFALSRLLYNSPDEEMSKMCKPGLIAFFVKLINSEESWKVKKNAILALKGLADHEGFSERVLEAGGLTAIVANIDEEFPAYMETACQTLFLLFRKRTVVSGSYEMQVLLPFILSHLNTSGQRPVEYYLFQMLSLTIKNNAENRELMQEIFTYLMRFMDTYISDEVLGCTLQALGMLVSLGSEYTDLLIENGLLRKVEERFPTSGDIVVCHHACYLLIGICTKTANIADKVVCSGLIPKVILLWNSDVSYIQETIVPVFSSICGHCSPTLIPQLLEMGIAGYLIEALSQPALRIECLGGLAAILRCIKTISNPEAFKSHINVEELAAKCMSLASSGVSEAQGLLKDLRWVISGNEEADVPTKKPRFS